jgi:hypothetical protein
MISLAGFIPVLSCRSEYLLPDRENLGLVFLDYVTERQLFSEAARITSVKTVQGSKGRREYRIVSPLTLDGVSPVTLAVYQGLLGTSFTAKHLIALSVNTDQPGSYRIGCIDLFGSVNYEIIYPRLPLNVRAVPDKSLYVVSEFRASSGKQSIWYTKNVNSWKSIDIRPGVEGGSQSVGVCIDSGTMVYSDDGVVYQHEMQLGRRYKVGKGTWANCSSDGRVFSYCDQKGRVVYGGLHSPLRTTTTPLEARDGVEWTPDGRYGVLARPSNQSGLFSRLNQIILIDTRDWSTKEVMEVGPRSGVSNVRWVHNAEQIEDRLQMWVTELAGAKETNEIR